MEYNGVQYLIDTNPFYSEIDIESLPQGVNVRKIYGSPFKKVAVIEIESRRVNSTLLGYSNGKIYHKELPIPWTYLVITFVWKNNQWTILPHDNTNHKCYCKSERSKDLANDNFMLGGYYSHCTKNYLCWGYYKNVLPVPHKNLYIAIRNAVTTFYSTPSIDIEGGAGGWIKKLADLEKLTPQQACDLVKPLELTKMIFPYVDEFKNLNAVNVIPLIQGLQIKPKEKVDVAKIIEKKPKPKPAPIPAVVAVNEVKPVAPAQPEPVAPPVEVKKPRRRYVPRAKRQEIV